MLYQFCKYNNWANSLLLDALMANADSLPATCISLFSHIVNAQSIWLSRINGISPDVAVWQENDLKTCRLLLEESVHGFSQLVFPETGVSPIISYNNTSGDYFETTLHDILLHVFNHGTYHRAQIAREMRLHQIKPVNTDYIQFVRLQSS